MKTLILTLTLVFVGISIGCDGPHDPHLRDFYNLTRLNTMSDKDRLKDAHSRAWCTSAIIGGVSFSAGAMLMWRFMLSGRRL